MRRLTPQPSLLLLSLLPKWKFQQLNIFLASHNSAWKNGRICGTVVRVTSFMLFTQTLVEFHTVKTCPGAMQWSLTDYDSNCLTHLHLLTGEDLPTCQFCSLPLTVNHILLECASWNTIRQRLFRVSSIKDLFYSIDNQIIIDFIKETHFYALV